MWGYYIGGMLTLRNYGGNRFEGDRYWFRPDILRQHTLERANYSSHPTLNAPLTEKQIFDCLTSDIRSHEQLNKRLTSRNGRQDEINVIFQSFGF